MTVRDNGGLTKVNYVLVAPIYARTEQAIYEKTTALIEQLRNNGYATYALDADGKPPREAAPPYVAVRAFSNDEYCLEGVLILERPVPMGSLSLGELRVFRSEGVTRLNNWQCAGKFIELLRAALRKHGYT